MSVCDSTRSLLVNKLVRTLFYLLLLILPMIAGKSVNKTCPKTDEPRENWLIIPEIGQRQIELSCLTPDFYPFCDKTEITSLVWELPPNCLSLKIDQTSRVKGWRTVDNNERLIIDLDEMPPGVDHRGIYRCIAQVTDPATQTSEWYSLMTAVDIYSSEPLLGKGSTWDRYKRNIITAIISSFTIVAGFAIFKFVSHQSGKQHKCRRTPCENNEEDKSSTSREASDQRPVFSALDENEAEGVGQTEQVQYVDASTPV